MRDHVDSLVPFSFSPDHLNCYVIRMICKTMPGNPLFGAVELVELTSTIWAAKEESALDIVRRLTTIARLESLHLANDRPELVTPKMIEQLNDEDREAIERARLATFDLEIVPITDEE